MNNKQTGLSESDKIEILDLYRYGFNLYLYGDASIYLERKYNKFEYLHQYRTSKGL